MQTRITLSKLSTNARLSRESPCFTADLLLDGKKIGEAYNEGSGGPCVFILNNPAQRSTLEKYCASLPSKFDGIAEMDLELIVLDLVETEITSKKLARLCRGKILFRIEGDSEDEYRTVKHNNDEAGARAFIAKKYGDRVIEIVNDRIK
jgi:hypothetical protein